MFRLTSLLFQQMYLTVPCFFHRFIYVNSSCSKTILSIRSGHNYSVNHYGLEIPKLENLKIALLSCELIFKFIFLDKLVREERNKRLFFPIFFLFFTKLAKRRSVLTSFTNVQYSFLWTKECTWVYLLLHLHIFYIFLFSSINSN